jgi:hypothetical protein
MKRRTSRSFTLFVIYLLFITPFSSLFASSTPVLMSTLDSDSTSWLVGRVNSQFAFLFTTGMATDSLYVVESIDVIFDSYMPFVEFILPDLQVGIFDIDGATGGPGKQMGGLYVYESHSGNLAKLIRGGGRAVLNADSRYWLAFLPLGANIIFLTTNNPQYDPAGEEDMLFLTTNNRYFFPSGDVPEIFQSVVEAPMVSLNGKVHSLDFLIPLSNIAIYAGLFLIALFIAYKIRKRYA